MERQELLSETVNAFSNTARLLKVVMHDAAHSDAIGPSQLHLLFAIANWQPAPTQKQLAESMHITPGALTQLIEPLVEVGYVTRQASQTDRRVMHLHLSPSGKKTLHSIKQERTTLFASMMDGLTDEELTVMLRAQQKMFHALEAHYKKERSTNA